jgi:glycosyltransferase involved in cell wall biosynthesis
MSTPRVAFDVTPLQNGHRRRGIGTYVRGLAEQLNAQEDVEVEFWGWRSPPFEVRGPHRGLWIPRPPMPSHRGAWLFAQAWLRLAAGRSDAEAVHVSDPNALLPLPGRHMLTTVHDLIPMHEGMPTGRLVQRLGYRRYLDALRRTNTLFAVSPQTAAEVAALTGRALEEVLIARVGISAPPPPAGRGVAGHYFLYVGGPDQHKNIGVLLDAIAILPDIPERLVIAGQWTRRQRLRLSRDLEQRGLAARVEHAGFVPAVQLERLLRGATAVVMPSRREGFGLPVAEAMARGVPVIHSDIEVLRTVSGSAALTFDPDQPAQLADALRRVSETPSLRARLVTAGLEQVAGMGWDETVELTLAAYRRAVSGTPAGTARGIGP